MAWRLTIDGVDRTAVVDAFSMSLALNDRGRATILVADLLPARYVEVISTAPDGVTPLFGGVILQRHFAGRTPADETFTASLECGDWFTYTDWAYTSAAYDVDVTLGAVLADLVASQLSAYGITLDPAQDAGPVLAAFAWADKRVSDALRELSDRTGYVARISAAKVLRMFTPGSEPAPFTMTEAAPNALELTWQDSDRTPYNAVTLTCGPAGVSPVIDERHDGDGARQRWPLFAPFLVMIGALATGSDAGGLDPGGLPVGIYGQDDMAWTVDLETNELVQRAGEPVRAAGEYVVLSYNATFPFPVRVATGATPPVEYAEARPDVRSIPVATEIATSMLASFQAAPRELQILTDADGLEPGQALYVDLPALRAVSGTFLVTAVALAIVLDDDGGNRLWQYTIDAAETGLYPGSYLDDWRKIAGIGGGSAGTVTGGGSGGGGDIGTGTPGRLAKWSTPTTLADSLLLEAPGLVTVYGDLTVAGTTRLGLVAAGTWQGSPVGLAYGGTAAALTAAAGAVVYSAAAALALSPVGVAGQLLQSAGAAAPTWSAARFPVGPATPAGAYLRATGTDWIASTLLLPNAATATRLVYATATNQWGESANLTFSGSALALVGDQTISGFISSPAFASQTTGWRIDATGGADFRYLFVDEMHTKSFVTDLEMALAGGQIIAKAVAMVAAPFTVPAAGAAATLRVRDLPSGADLPAFQAGDTVAMRVFGRDASYLYTEDCVGAVSGYADQPDGTQTWTFTRAAGANGGIMGGGGVILADSLAIDYGVSGNGYYEVNARDGAAGANSPYAQIVTWVTAPTGATRPCAHGSGTSTASPASRTSTASSPGPTRPPTARTSARATRRSSSTASRRNGGAARATS